MEGQLRFLGLQGVNKRETSVLQSWRRWSSISSKKKKSGNNLSSESREPQMNVSVKEHEMVLKGEVLEYRGCSQSLPHQRP